MRGHTIFISSISIVPKKAVAVVKMSTKLVNKGCNFDEFTLHAGIL